MVSSDDVEWKSVFEEGTLHRTFKIIVEDKTFFVNPSFLAERSSFFETLLFGDFKEKKEGKAELKDVKAKDFEEFLLVLGADPKKKKKVEVRNFATIANFSHLWDVETLREKCIVYIGSAAFRSHPAGDVKAAIDICSACERIKVPVQILKLVAARLTRFPVKVLAENDAHNQLSSAMSTAVYLASQRRTICSVPKAQTARCCNVVCSAHSPSTVEKSPIHLTLDYLYFCAVHTGVDFACERKNDGGDDAGSTSDDSIIILDDDDDDDDDVIIDDMFFPTV